MPKKDLAEIVCIVDRSGSMRSIQDDAIGGFNTFLDEQKKVPGDAQFTLVLFDDQYDIIHDGADIDKVNHLDKTTFVPRGMTALLDAVGKTLNTLDERLGKTDEAEKPEKVMVAILTDGAENASREYQRQKIMEMITEKKEKHDWEFIFLAANQDAIEAGGSIGIGKGSSFAFAATSSGMRGSVKSLSMLSTSYRTSDKAAYKKKKASLDHDIK